MAAYTSSQTGNWSSSSTWGGSGPPGAGDTATVASGHTVTVDVDTTVGATAGLTAPAVTIGGTDSSSFGTLRVASGVALTLRGTDFTAAKCMMLINRYGLFAPQAGSTVLGETSADFGSGIRNLGRLEAIGSVGSRITFSVPTPPGWAVAGGSAVGSTHYDRAMLLQVLPLGSVSLSNAAGTGPGSAGDTSLSWSGSPPFGLTTEVAWQGSFDATVALLDANGKYYVDYDNGYVYLYNSSFGSFTITPAFKKLDRSAANWRGWGIVSYGGTTSNTALFRYCDFRYMGGVSGSISINGMARRAPLNLDGHQSAGKVGGGDASRLCYVRDCTFSQCIRWLQFQAIDGTAGDPILVTGNAFNNGEGGTSQACVQCQGGLGTNYVSFDSNAISHSNTALDLSPLTLQALAQTPGQDNAGWSVTNNVGISGGTFLQARNVFHGMNEPDARFGAKSGTPGLYVAGNDLRGSGNTTTPDTRFLNGVGGTAASPAIVEGNYFHHCKRFGHLASSYVTYRKNRFYAAYHHGFTGSPVDDTYVTDTRFENNLFSCDRGATNTSSTSAALQLGYNHRCVVNNFAAVNNTVDGWLYGLLDFNDVVDNNGPLLATNVVAVNNIVANGGYAFCAYASDTIPQRLHVLECDFNDRYNQATAYGYSGGSSTALNNTANPTDFYQGSDKYNRLASGSRNVPGVALFDATYTANQAGANNRSLAYTVNTLGQDHTLAWGAGPAVQLVATYGTSSGQGIRTIGVSGGTSIALVLTGTLSSTSGSAAVTGVGTAFATELQAGDYLRIGLADPIGYKVSAIADDTHLTLTTNCGLTNSAQKGVRQRADARNKWLWVVSGRGSGQARAITWATPNTAYSASVSGGSGGTGWTTGDYATYSSSTNREVVGAQPIVRVTASGGVVTAAEVVSGGAFLTPPGNPVSFTRLTGTNGSGLTLTLTWGPGYYFVPDLTTGLDATSVFAVVNPTVQLSDGAGKTVQAGLYLPDPSSPLTAVQLPTASQTDAGISVYVDRGQAGNPNFVTSTLSNDAAQYKVTGGSAAIDAATTDGVPSADYFGTSRPQGSAPDMGFYEYLAGSLIFHLRRMSGGFTEMG